MIIRKAQKKDIPFIVNAIIEIEKTNDNSNTFNNLFACNTETTKNYLEQFFLDEENLDTELSLNTYIIAEINGETAGCCCLIYMDINYYEQKSEIFPIHLNKLHLEKFINTVKTLPNTKQFAIDKHFLEYLYVSEKYRGEGVSKEIIYYFFSKTEILFLMPLINNTFAIKYYEKLGFQEVQNIKTFFIEQPNQKIYPCDTKIMLYKKNKYY